MSQLILSRYSSIASFILKTNSTADTTQTESNPIATITQEQILTFQTGGEEVYVSKPAIAHDQRFLQAAHENTIHTLYNFLQRPIKVGTVVLTTAQGVNTLLFTFNAPNDILSKPMWADKMKNFRFFRATLNFKFLVNGNTFSVGRWLAWWSPFHDERGVRKPLIQRQHMTAYNCVEIDLGNKMTANLRVPYVSPFSHIDLLRDDQPYGKMFLYVLNPLNDVSAGVNANMEIYLHLSDIDLAIPTYTGDLMSLNMVAHMRRGNKEQEVRSHKGVISGAANVVGKVAKAFENVPVVGEIAKPVSWFADAASGLAEALGFSKPVSMQAVQPIVNYPAQGYTNSSGLTDSFVLASNPQNEIVPSYKIFGTDVDEMDITYICNKSAWLRGLLWNDTDPYQTRLFQMPVHAGLCARDGASTPPATRMGSLPISFVASMFKYWRGTLVFRISLVKNPYYSGRLAFAYLPGWTTAQVSAAWPAGIDLNALTKIIWDVKEDSDITIAVPYQAQTQYLRVRLSDRTMDDQIDMDTAGGTIICYVETPLRHPSNTPSSIQGNIWFSAGHDIEFMEPDFSRYSPIQNGTDPPEEVLVAQMFKVEQTFDHDQLLAGKNKPEGMSLLEVTPTVNTFPAEHCGGEIVKNLRLLTRRIGPYSHTMNAQEWALLLDPAWFFQYDTGAYANIGFRINQVPLHYISYLYVFYTGGREYIIQKLRNSVYVGTGTNTTVQDVNTTIVRSDDINSQDPKFLNWPVSAYRSGMFEGRSFTSLSPLIQVKCPYYSNVPIQLISDQYITTNHLRARYAVETQPRQSADYVAPLWQVFTGFSDDGGFGYQVGGPEMYDYGQ